MMKREPKRPFKAICQALSSPTRMMIIQYLIKEGKCVTEIQEKLRISQPGVSQHLKVLLHAGLVKRKRMGKKVCYIVEKKAVIERLIRVIGKL